MRLDVSEVERACFSLDKLEEGRFDEDIALEGVKEDHLHGNVLEVDRDVFLSEVVLVQFFLLLADIHEVLGLDLLVDDLDLGLGPLEHRGVEVRYDFERDPDLVVVLRIDEGDQGR